MQYQFETFFYKPSLTDKSLSFCQRTLGYFLTHLAVQFVFNSILIVNLMTSYLVMCISRLTKK